LIDSSTIDPAVSRAMSEAAKAKGAIFVDAPVSGGVNAAAAGTLTFMVGADKAEDFEAAQKVLAFMGKSITHCGQVGTGQAVKVVIFSFLRVCKLRMSSFLYIIFLSLFHGLPLALPSTFGLFVFGLLECLFID
jgi:3-hydroxyisobutyrate dehydrogenase-like beta-hydroxyacid dehydrogenase